jgi:hypothetical protein
VARATLWPYCTSPRAGYGQSIISSVIYRHRLLDHPPSSILYNLFVFLGGGFIASTRTLVMVKSHARRRR